MAWSDKIILSPCNPDLVRAAKWAAATSLTSTKQNGILGMPLAEPSKIYANKPIELLFSWTKEGPSTNPGWSVTTSS